MIPVRVYGAAARDPSDKLDIVPSAEIDVDGFIYLLEISERHCGSVAAVEM
jgi:hypothetical protein